MENLIKKSQQMTKLLTELKDSTHNEQFLYTVKYEYTMGQDDVYSLYDNKNKKLLRTDKAERIDSWLHIRNIHESVIHRITKLQ